VTKPFEPFDLVAKWLPESPFAEPGHVVVVRRSEKTMRALLKDGLQITQVRSHNHTSTREHSLAAYGITRTR
jgi:hypothetical protein